MTAAASPLALYGLVAATAAISVAGDYFLKLGAARGAGALSPEFALGAGLYVLTALGWMVAMRALPLAAIAVAYSAAMIVLLALLGVVAFGERLSGRELAGLCCAVAAVALMHRPD